MVKYNESIIYKLCCKDPTITDEYIGSTTNFSRRKTQHKSRCNREKSNFLVYVCIRENGNFENWDMVEVEKYEASDKQDLHKRERYWIETLKSSLNKQIPTQTSKEHYEDNKERITIRNKKYTEEHKEYFVEYKKKHYQENKEKINNKCKKYAEENKEKMANQRKEVNVKVKCECGSEVLKFNLTAHKKSKKHLTYLVK